MFGSGGPKKRKVEEAELDITPMIDVTFLLLIFFMVTSTMKPTPDKDIPRALMGKNADMGEGVVDVTIRASALSDGDIEMDDRPVSLEQLRADLLQKTAGGEFKVMLFVERDVRSGTVGEVEGVIGEVAKDAQVEIKMSFAVREKR